MADDATSTGTAPATGETEDEEAERLLAEAAAENGTAGADQLGDAGKKALDRMKAQVKAAKAEAAAYKGLGLSAEELQELIAKSAEDTAKAEQAKQRADMESAALSKANERLVSAEIRAAAAGKLANPALAVKLLNAADFEVNDDGEVDSEAINAAVDELVAREPYLAAAQSGQRFQGGADQGPRGTSGPKQLTEADVKQLTADKNYAEIDKARREGRLNAVLGITT